MDDKLDMMLRRGKELQEALGISAEFLLTQEYKEKMVLAAIDELMEMLRATPWKPWKINQKYDEENFKEELVDLMHFVMNLMLSCGMSADECAARFIKKNVENHERKIRGY